MIIDSGDGTGNTTAPVDDPGWANVGTVNGLSCVYLRNGWVLTANHVGTGNVQFDGPIIYGFIAGTAVRLSNGDGTFPDLKVFAITPDPGFAELPIRSSPTLPNDVVMIGYGKDRGFATDSDDPVIWQAPPDPPVPPIPGFRWGGAHSKRWGANRVGGAWPGNPLNTVSFFTVFDDPTAPAHVGDEAQAAEGDSGGAVFAKQGATWELAGIMFAVGLHPGHLNNSVLRDELTGAGDLRSYRDEILALTATPVPEPSGSAMLAAGGALLALLDRRRTRP